MEYVCKTKCFYRDHLFEEGEKYVSHDPDEKVPEHFEAVGSEKPAKPKRGAKGASETPPADTPPPADNPLDE